MLTPTAETKRGRPVGSRRLLSPTTSLLDIMAQNEEGVEASIVEEAKPDLPTPPPESVPTPAPAPAPAPISEPVATEAAKGLPAPPSEPQSTPINNNESANNSENNSESFTDSSGQQFDILDESFADETFSKQAAEFEEIDPDTPEYAEAKGAFEKSKSIPIENSKPSLDEKDLEQFAGFGVDFLDGLASLGLSFFAGEGRPKEYEMDKDKKRLLTKQLAAILKKRNIGGGMSFELMFLITFMSAYIPAGIAAMDRRKNRLRMEAENNSPNMHVAK